MVHERFSQLWFETVPDGRFDPRARPALVPSGVALRIHTRGLYRRADSLWMSLEWHCCVAAANLGSKTLASGFDLDIITVTV